MIHSPCLHVFIPLALELWAVQRFLPPVPFAAFPTTRRAGWWHVQQAAASHPALNSPRSVVPRLLLGCAFRLPASHLPAGSRHRSPYYHLLQPCHHLDMYFGSLQKDTTLLKHFVTPTYPAFSHHTHPITLHTLHAHPSHLYPAPPHTPTTPPHTHPTHHVPHLLGICSTHTRYRYITRCPFRHPTPPVPAARLRLPPLLVARTVPFPHPTPRCRMACAHAA